MADTVTVLRGNKLSRETVPNSGIEVAPRRGPARPPRPRAAAKEPAATAVPAPRPATGDVASAQAALGRAKERAAAAAAEMAREAQTGKGRGWDKAKRVYDQALAAEAVAQAQVAAALEAERSRSPAAMATQLMLYAAAPLAGMAFGKTVLAKGIERREKVNIDARNRQMRRLAGDLDRALARPPSPSTTARVAGIVKSADQLRLGPRMSRVLGGPAAVLGLSGAAILLGEGLFLRKSAGEATNETTRDILTGIGTALTFAAGGQIAARVTQSATASKLLDASALARIEGGRAALVANAVGGEASRARSAPKIIGPAEVGRMTRADIRAELKRRGISAPAKARKAQLVASLERAIGGAKSASAPAPDARPPVARGVLKSLGGKRVIIGAAALGAVTSLFGAGAAQAQGRAYLAGDARGRAQAAPIRPAAAAAGSGNRRSDRIAYRRVDDVVVMSTRARARSDRRRRKNGG